MSSTAHVPGPRRNLKSWSWQEARVAICLGALLVVFGAVVSAGFLEQTYFLEGTISGTARRAPAWVAFRVLLVTSGLYLLLWRPRITLLDLGIIGAVTLVLSLLGILVVQFTLSAQPIVSGWKSFAPADEQNLLGFRGQPIQYADGDFVIVMVGDSQVEAMAMKHEVMPERRLQTHLRQLGVPAKVFSVAAGGYGQDQQLLGLERYFESFRADLVVVWQTPTNDIWNNQFLTNMFSWHSKPTYWLAGDDLKGPTKFVGQPLCDSRLVVAAMWCRVISLPHRAKAWERWMPTAYKPLDRWDGEVSRDWQERWDSNVGLMRKENLPTEQSHMATELTPRSKRMDYGIALTRALMLRIQGLADSHGAKLVVMQTAMDDASRSVERIYLLNGKYYRVLPLQSDDTWAKVNAGLDFVTLPITVKDWKVGPNDAHLNEPATDQVMQDFAAYLGNRVMARTDARQTF